MWGAFTTNVICTNADMGPVQVFYPPPLLVWDPCCGTNWSMAYSPTNGSYFELGTTTNVQCVVWDDCGNSASCSFKVMVQCYVPNPVIAITNHMMKLYIPTNMMAQPLPPNWNWQLWQSTNVIGPWTTVSTSAPPYYISNWLLPQQFFRLALTNGP